MLSPSHPYSPLTARDAALLSEADTFQTRGCSVSSLRHILPQTLPSKQVSGLTLCSSFSRPGTGECWIGGNAGQRGYLAEDSLLRAIFYSWLFSPETDENRQLWGADGGLFCD